MGPVHIKALVFDFGGVLTNPVWETFAAFCSAEGLDPEAVKELFRNDAGAMTDLRGLETGELAEADFEQSFAERLGVGPEGLIDRLFAGMAPDEEMVGLVRSARAAGLKTALLSNSWSVGHYDREMLSELFDVAVISGEVGLHKPQPEIYALTVERLGVEAAACVFIDDLRENCEGAEAAGMQALRHRTAAETIPKLEEMTGLALRAGGDHQDPAQSQDDAGAPDPA
jgi:epoxide hydrolase-like predicted phosphatase